MTILSPQSYKFCELIAICGELPANVLSRLDTSASYRYKLISALRKDKYIRIYTRDRIKSYRLTQKAKKYLLKENPERFELLIARRNELNSYRSDKQRRLRLHNSAHVFITAMKSGIELFIDKKTSLMQFSRVHTPLFYSALELKNLGIEYLKVRNSRSAGLIFSENQLLMTYNTGDTIMKWEYQTELRLQTLIKHHFCTMNRLYDENKVSGIMFGGSLEAAYSLLINETNRKQSLFRLDNLKIFDRFYFCPNTSEGEKQLYIMLHRFDEIKKQLLSDYMPSTGFLHMECDAINKNHQPIIVELNFDMIRIKRFRDALQLFSRTGIVYCYNFQADTLRRYMGNLAEVHPITIEGVIKHGLDKKGG